MAKSTYLSPLLSLITLLSVTFISASPVNSPELTHELSESSESSPQSNADVNHSVTNQWSIFNKSNVSTEANDTHANDSPSPYFGDQLYQFRLFYQTWHGYLSIIICIFGIIANVLNIIVLTRKDMVSATNAILTGMAAADLMVIGSCIPFTSHHYLRSDQSHEVMFTYGWAIFILFHAHFTVVCHTVSIWLNVLLAIWRYLAVRSPTKGNLWCSITRAKWAIIMTYVSVPIFCLPSYLTFKIKEFRIENCDSALYKVDFSDISLLYGKLLQTINFWVFGVFNKVFPCLLLMYVSIALIRILYDAKRRKARLRHSGPALETSAVSNGNARHESTNIRTKEENSKNSIIKLRRGKSNKSNNKHNESDRTTRMLIAVLLTFTICELPSGTMSFASGIFGEVFFTHVYVNFSEIMDILALLSCAINFVLYCSMSAQFRQTFRHLFSINAACKFGQLSQVLVKRRSLLVNHNNHCNNCNTTVATNIATSVVIPHEGELTCV